MRDRLRDALAPFEMMERLEKYVRAMKDGVEIMHSSTSFWSDAIKLAQRPLSS
jgi:hypothetical protein